MTQIDFDTFDATGPDFEQLKSQYLGIQERVQSAATAADCESAISDWDQIRRDIDTWKSMVHLRFSQDTANAEYKAAREACDAMSPKIREQDVAMMKLLLASSHKDALKQKFGDQAFSLWEVDVTTYAPVIEADMVRQSKLEADYTELLAAAEVQFEGKSYNLSEITKFLERPERDVRYHSSVARWQWFESHQPQLNEIYDQMVHLRHGMAHKLGLESYIDMGYRLMTRIDYNQDDVANFRRQVREQLVPLASKLRSRQAQTLGVDKLKYWDQNVFSKDGNPAPKGDHDWMVQRAEEMFDAMSPDLSQFFRLMVSAKLMDLKSRKGKAGGGFCTSMPRYGVPYIFANFNGTKGDVEVFTHEMGHAFQNYMSRNVELIDYMWPTTEACEIHSMSLEFLTWPHMEKFFGSEDGKRFCDGHLEQSVLFIPYGVAVDHFQHLVYAEPDASPQRRYEMWQEMEAMYLPWRDYGDLPHTPAGGMWQAQRHIYLCPFYYIDYTLAQTCALQYWDLAERDFDSAMDSYVELCKRGGTLPFQQLAQSAGLISPFSDGCLGNVLQRVQQTLQVA